MNKIISRFIYWNKRSSLYCNNCNIIFIFVYLIQLYHWFNLNFIISKQNQTQQEGHTVHCKNYSLASFNVKLVYHTVYSNIQIQFILLSTHSNTIHIQIRYTYIYILEYDTYSTCSNAVHAGTVFEYSTCIHVRIQYMYIEYNIPYLYIRIQ